MIKDLGLPEQIEKKLTSCINYAKSKQMTLPHILLVGCPSKFVSRIHEAIANEMNVNAKWIESGNLKQGDLAAILTNLSEGDIVSLAQIGTLKSDVAHVFEQAILNFQINITIGKGPSAKNFLIDLPSFCALLWVENLNQIQKNLLEAFFEIIDFTKYDYELRIMMISDFAERYSLNFEPGVKETLAKQFTNDEQLKLQLIEIRTKAFEESVFDITESFLQGSLAPLPEFEKINAMDGRAFELFTGDLFRALGYSNVTVTQSSGDFGADVIAEKDDVRFAIQCKRYSVPVGVSAVQEVMASKSLHDCHVACILTNNTFTPAAEELARKNLVILWGGHKLKEFIDRTQ